MYVNHQLSSSRHPPSLPYINLLHAPHCCHSSGRNKSPPPFSFPEIPLTTGLHNVNPYPLKVHCSRFPPQGTSKEKGEGERERGRTLPAADRVRSYTSLPAAKRSLEENLEEPLAADVQSEIYKRVDDESDESHGGNKPGTN